MTPFDQALHDYFYNKEASELTIHNNYGDPEEMPLEVFFREGSDLSDLDLIALDFADGDILDIGSAAGVHSLYLQEMNQNVTALDTSPMACEIMRQRGVKKIINESFYNEINQQFDTLILLMNGFGLCGKMEQIPQFLEALRHLLKPNGKVLVDSSNVAYMYDKLPEDHYYGEVEFCYEYKHILGDWFNWLYIDQETLVQELNKCNWSCDILFEDGNDQYLAIIKPNNYD